MRAIVLAAGRGERLRPLTDAVPKCLVPFRGRTILAHIAEALERAGVRDVIVVTGYRADAITALGFRTRHNADFATTNMVHSLFCAEDVLEGDVLIVYGDIVFGPAIVEALAREPASLAVAVNTRWRELWQQRMRDPLADAESLRLDGRGYVVEIGRRPRGYEDVQAQYMGLVRIGREATPRLRAFYRSLDRDRLYEGRDFHNMFMTAFLQEVIDRLMPIKAVPVDGGWVEVDSLSDLAAYEALPEAFFA